MSESYIAKRANQNVKEGLGDLDPALKIANVERQEADHSEAYDKKNCKNREISLENII